MRFLPVLMPSVNGATAYFADRGGGLLYHEDEAPVAHELEDMVAAKARAKANRPPRRLRTRLSGLVRR